MASSSSVEIDAEVLATLARKSHLAPLATRDEMHAAIAAAIAPLATREDLRAAFAPLATRRELRDLRSELLEDGERTRRYFDIVAERLQSSIHRGEARTPQRENR